MKRFLIYVMTLLVLVTGSIYLIYIEGFYIKGEENAPVEVLFFTEGKELMMELSDGSRTAFEIKGVDMIASLPGKFTADYAPTQKDYFRWLTYIGEMGANTVRVYTVMDDDFYNALYAYNKDNDAPIYLLQGLWVSDEANNGSKDAYDDIFMGSLLADGETAVDVIHGRKIGSATKTCGGGNYFRDVSPWTIGYLVGNEWNADVIAYTDNSVVHSGEYGGEYFSTTEDATAFEAMLARVLEKIVSYETDKYGKQRPVGFISAPDTDFLIYEEMYARQLSKYAYLNAEHIVPSDKVQAGYFAAYRLMDFSDGFTKYLDEGQQSELAKVLEGIHKENSFYGYLDLLAAYHSMPVVAAGFSASSSRGVAASSGKPLTEEQQGEALMEMYTDARDAGFAGGFLSSWQDAWDRRTWNTSFAMDLTRNRLWHDLQSESQNTGLMDFEPGKEAVCILDGNPLEWTKEKAVLTTEGKSVFVKYDQEGLYLLIQGEGVSSETPLYMPFDMSDEVGSVYCSEPRLTFDKEVDFVLCLNGMEESRLLVQERYDALRENYGYEIGGDNPFLSVPGKDSSTFVPVNMAFQNNTLVNVLPDVNPDELRKLRSLGTWETGQLVHGNGDPDAADYNSLTDFCYGKNCVEVRIPWLLINVSDPTAMMVHRDYYTQYGVKAEGVAFFNLGLGDGGSKIELTSVKTTAWNWKLTWRERLKRSYYVVQEHWK